MRVARAAPAGAKHLPWDLFNIIFASLVPPAADALGVASACAKGVAVSIRLCVGTSGTAKIHSASSRCAAGRLPSDKENVANVPRLTKPMQPPNASVALATPNASVRRTAGRLRLGVHLRRRKIRIQMRGHAAKIFLLLFVTVPAVMKRCVHLGDARLVTAVVPVAKPSAAYVIANVSGWRATAKRDDSNVAVSTRPGAALKALVRLSRWRARTDRDFGTGSEPIRRSSTIGFSPPRVYLAVDSKEVSTDDQETAAGSGPGATSTTRRLFLDRPLLLAGLCREAHGRCDHVVFLSRRCQ